MSILVRHSSRTRCRQTLVVWIGDQIESGRRLFSNGRARLNAPAAVRGRMLVDGWVDIS